MTTLNTKPVDRPWQIRRVEWDGIVATATGMLIVTVSERHSVYSIDPINGELIRLCGDVNGAAGTAVGNALDEARFNLPIAVLLSKDERRLFIIDSNSVAVLTL